MGSEEEFGCPHCGELIPGSATFCRHCGASEEMGWNDDALGWDADHETGYAADGDEDFDYDSYVEREFPEDYPPSAEQVRRRSLVFLVMLLISIGLLATSILAAMRGQF